MKPKATVKGSPPARVRAIEDALRQSGFELSADSTARAGVSIAAAERENLWVRMGRRSVSLDCQASVEEIVFWASELWYSRGRAGGPRYPIELPVVVAHGAQVYRTTSSDLSSTGIFALLAEPPSRGEAVGIELHLDDEQPPLRAFGIVVRSVRSKADKLVDDEGATACSHPGAAIELVGVLKQGRERLARRVERARRENQQR